MTTCGQAVDNRPNLGDKSPAPESSPAQHATHAEHATVARIRRGIGSSGRGSTASGPAREPLPPLTESELWHAYEGAKGRIG